MKFPFITCSRKITHVIFTIPSETYDDQTNSLDYIFSNYLAQGIAFRQSVEDNDIDHPLLYDADMSDVPTVFEVNASNMAESTSRDNRIRRVDEIISDYNSSFSKVESKVESNVESKVEGEGG